MSLRVRVRDVLLGGGNYLLYFRSRLNEPGNGIDITLYLGWKKIDPLLVVTSALFFIPSCLAFSLGRLDFALPYGLLTCVSSVFHWTKNRTFLYLDYPICYWITVVLAIEAWKLNLIPYFCVGGGSVFILFWVGYYYNSMVFSKRKKEKLFSHSLMHLIVNISACSMLIYSTHSYAKSNKIFGCS